MNTEIVPAGAESVIGDAVQYLSNVKEYLAAAGVSPTRLSRVDRAAGELAALREPEASSSRRCWSLWVAACIDKLNGQNAPPEVMSALSNLHACCEDLEKENVDRFWPRREMPDLLNFSVLFGTFSTIYTRARERDHLAIANIARDARLHIRTVEHAGCADMSWAQGGKR